MFHCRVARFFSARLTKTGGNIPNIPRGHKLYQISVKYLDPMAINYTKYP
jgi:hypothetical protein